MIRLALVCVLLGHSAQALTLPLPSGAELTREVTSLAGSRAVPIGPTQDGFTPTLLAEGAVLVQSYRVPGIRAPSTLLGTIVSQLEADGYAPIFRCVSDTCGGFDFRFSLNLIPPPAMFVDLSDYLFYSAEGPDGQHVSIVASRSQSDGYIHLVHVTPGDVATPVVRETARPPVPLNDFGAALETTGSVVLEDLIFESGTTTLPDDTYPSLTALSDYLKANPNMRIALVGHTDASGALDLNISISKRRAQAARQKLIDRYDVPSNQVAAEGMGYLAPRASNLTEDGRDRNRRVEAILTSTGR